LRRRRTGAITIGMESAADRLVALLTAERPDREAIAHHLDGLGASERAEAIRALAGPRLQRRLWDAVADALPVTLGDLVPVDSPPLDQIVYEGKNSLPAFTLFQKRFCRPRRGGDELWGYNHASLAWLIGPGYFVVHDDGAQGAAIDYRLVPPEHPPSWPAVRPNDRGASRFVYGNMVDYLRRVARGVFIGSAYRGGKPIDSYFVLSRAA
jgi:hypothetical protein